MIDMRINALFVISSFSLFLITFLLIPFSTLIGKLVVSAIFFILYSKLAVMEQKHFVTISKSYNFIILCFCLLAVLILLFIIFYPGGMITDSHYLFSMAYKDEFRSYRSRFLALIYQFLFLAHKSTLPILATQVLLYALAISLLIFNLVKKGLSVYALLIFCLAFVPTLSGMVGVLCENSWITICYLFGVIYFYISIKDNRVNSLHFMIVMLFFVLAFFTRFYDVLYGLPLFFVLFNTWLKKVNVKYNILFAIVLTLMMIISHVGVNYLIDKTKGTVDSGKSLKLLNYYRALPVPFDDEIKLPADVKKNIISKLKHKKKNQGWRASNELGYYSILKEGKNITSDEIIPELLEYIRIKPYIFLKGYLSRAVYLLVIPSESNWITWTRFYPKHKMSVLDINEYNSYLEKKYVQYSNAHEKYAYIYQPIAILILSLTTLLLTIVHYNHSNTNSLLMIGWACSGFIQVLVNLLLAYHGAFRLYHWSAVSSIFIIILIHADINKKR